MQTYLTLTELRTKLGNRSRSAIYADLAAGRLPKPMKLGGRIYWAEDDVQDHLRNLRDRAVDMDGGHTKTPNARASGAKRGC